MMNIRVSDWVAKFLAEQGVRHVYELSGGMITYLLDSLHRGKMIDIISLHHEQSASFAADAVGRLTGVPGIAMATSGPGALNLLTGMGGSYFDSSPTVFLTGQVNRNELKGDRGIRQLGFQETDIVSVARPLVKAAWMAENPESVPELLARAFKVATEGRPGPVLLDLPMDVQRAEIPIPAAGIRNTEFVQGDAAEMMDLLASASRPLVLAGGGIRSARAVHAYRAFIQAAGVPAVHSLMAVDSLPADHPCRVGLIGTYGNRWANLALGACDTLVVLGSRLDVRQTSSRLDCFSAGKTILHVDCDPAEMNNRVTGCQTVVSHLKPFLEAATKLANTRSYPDWCDWKKHISDLYCCYPDTGEQGILDGINPNVLMHCLSTYSKNARAFIVDVGQHQMWAAQSLDLHADQAFLTSGGMGAMGFALPAAIGAALTLAPNPVVAIAGDGAFQVNIQELEVVVRRGLPIKTVVLNNRSHGMVRQFQEAYFEGRLQSTVWGYGAPDFARIAEAYGMPAMTLEHEADMEDALTWLWREPTKPALLQVMIPEQANAFPKVMFGQPLTVMEP